MTQNPTPVLEARGLALSYNGKAAFSQVHLGLKEKTVTAIIGPSGCGKSSLLLALNRLSDLIPGCSVQGDILLGGRSIFSPEVNVRVLRQRIGMIFQRPNPFPLSILNNLLLPLREIQEGDKQEKEGKAEALLKQVGLWKEVKDRLHHPAASLSGGQQQRLCIARALTVNPSILLMDEPCSALDPISSGVIEDLVHSLKKELSVLVVTHNLAQAKRIADDAAFFWFKEGSGRLVEAGSAHSVFNFPQHQLTRDYLSGVKG